MSTWPLLPKRESDHPFFADDAFEIAVEELAQSQNTVMVWLNDPAHNPTGLTMTAEGRRVAPSDIMMASAFQSIQMLAIRFFLGYSMQFVRY